MTTPRQQSQLTSRKVASLKPQSKRYIVRGGDGLAIRVSTAGKKTWLVIYQFDGHRKWFKLGEYPDMSLKAAQEHCRAAKVQIDKGIDPSVTKVAERSERIQAPDVDMLIDEYMVKWAKPNKRSWKEDERILKKEISPEWGRRKVGDITKRDIVLLLEGIVERGAPIMSNNTLAVVRRMFNFAVERDLLSMSPAAGVKPLAKKKTKDRHLSDEEIKQLWVLLDDHDLIISHEVRQALRLVLVTGQRPGEVVGICRKEIKGRWWEIPEERSKNKKAHKVYLSDLALSLLTSPPGQEYFFGSPRVGKAADVTELTKPRSIKSNALPRALGRNFKSKQIKMKPFTPHDLRRTAATQMVKMGISVDVVIKILNHTDQRVVAIYNQHDYTAEIQKALEAWSDQLVKIINRK